MVTPLKSSSLVLVMISSMFASICSCFHAKRANSGKIATFRGASLTRASAGLLHDLFATWTAKISV